MYNKVTSRIVLERARAKTCTLEELGIGVEGGGLQHKDIISISNSMNCFQIK